MQALTGIIAAAPLLGAASTNVQCSWFVYCEHDHTSLVQNPIGSRSWNCVGDNGWGRGRGCFAARGEWFRVKDTIAEGDPVVLIWRLYDDPPWEGGRLKRQGHIWHTYGAGSGYAHRNKSFSENEYVKFRLCGGVHVSDGTHYVEENSCGPWDGSSTG